MVKTGETRLPLERIPAIARALEVDPGYLMRLALMEYEPALFEVLMATLGKPLTRNGRALVEIYRKIAPMDDIAIEGRAAALPMPTLDSLHRPRRAIDLRTRASAFRPRPRQRSMRPLGRKPSPYRRFSPEDRMS